MSRMQLAIRKGWKLKCTACRFIEECTYHVAGIERECEVVDVNGPHVIIATPDGFGGRGVAQSFEIQVPRETEP